VLEIGLRFDYLLSGGVLSLAVEWSPRCVLRILTPGVDCRNFRRKRSAQIMCHKFFGELGVWSHSGCCDQVLVLKIIVRQLVQVQSGCLN